MISESSSVRTEKKRIFINNILSNLIRERDSTANNLRNLKINDYYELSIKSSDCEQRQMFDD